jgi:hypothetical protein
MGLFRITHLPTMSSATELNDKFVYIEDFIVPRGQHPPSSFNEREFVLTKTFKTLLKQLASIVAVTDYPVIL